MAEEMKSNATENLPIRPNLVDIAVGFLLNPSVKPSSDDSKIAFLKNKGLTAAEIAEAFNRAKYEASAAFASNQNNQLVNGYPLPPYRAPFSFWYQVGRYSSAFVSFAVAVYVLHRFYKTYIEPWLFGGKSKQSEISALKEQLTELTNSISKLTCTVASLEEAVTNQMHQIDRTSLYGVESVPKSMKDIQDDISNVKSLLLNRFSFPVPPTLMGTSVENKTQNGESKAAAKVVTIPKWQLRNSEKSKADSKEQSDEGEDKQISSEPSPLVNGLTSVKDQAHDQEKIANDKMQNEGSRIDSENSMESLEDKDENFKECLENNLSVEGKTHDEDSKTILENGVKNADEKVVDDDSGIELHNSSSDSDSTLWTNGSVSTKNSE